MQTAPTTVDPEGLAYFEARRLARYRISGAIFLVVLLAVGVLGWKAVRHLSAAWWLEANSFAVMYRIDRDNWKLGGVTAVRFSSEKYQLFSSERPTFELKYLNHLHHLEELDLATIYQPRDQDLSTLDQFPDLVRLNLDQLNNPQGWPVESGELTDATAARIGRLAKLRELRLGGQKVTDAGLKELAKLDQLEYLDLMKTRISDRGLELLEAMPRLKSLDVTGTQVTARGVAHFEAARPGIRVVADHLPTVPWTPSTPDPKTPR